MLQSIHYIHLCGCEIVHVPLHIIYDLSKFVIMRRTKYVHAFVHSGRVDACFDSTMADRNEHSNGGSAKNNLNG